MGNFRAQMIPVSDLIEYICPNCGYIQKSAKGSDPLCPKCQPDFEGWKNKLDKARVKENE